MSIIIHLSAVLFCVLELDRVAEKGTCLRAVVVNRPTKVASNHLVRKGKSTKKTSLDRVIPGYVITYRALDDQFIYVLNRKKKNLYTKQPLNENYVVVENTNKANWIEGY